MGPNGIGKPMTVEIKALMIDGKQMTLRVFRQLQKEDLIDYETGLLTGKPLGYVNCELKDCSEDDPHLDVVWQKGNELRRDCVIRGGRIPFWMSADKLSALRCWLAQAVLEGKVTDVVEKYSWILHSDDNLRLTISPYLSCLSAFQREIQGEVKHDDVETPEQMARRMKEMDRYMKERHACLKNYVADHPYEKGSIERVKHSIAEFESNWEQSYAAVEAAGQLFIAV